MQENLRPGERFPDIELPNDGARLTKLSSQPATVGRTDLGDRVGELAVAFQSCVGDRGGGLLGRGRLPLVSARSGSFSAQPKAPALRSNSTHARWASERESPRRTRYGRRAGACGWAVNEFTATPAPQIHVGARSQLSSFPKPLHIWKQFP